MNLLARGFVGLGIPFLAIVPTIPILSHMSVSVFGMPIAVVWLLCCIPLTSGCLAVCWFLHDRHVQDEAPSPP